MPRVVHNWDCDKRYAALSEKLGKTGGMESIENKRES